MQYLWQGVVAIFTTVMACIMSCWRVLHVHVPTMAACLGTEENRDAAGNLHSLWNQCYMPGDAFALAVGVPGGLAAGRRNHEGRPGGLKNIL